LSRVTGAVGAANHEPSEARAAGWLTSTRGGKYLPGGPMPIGNKKDYEKIPGALRVRPA
jgi:hypothetical protein